MHTISLSPRLDLFVFKFPKDFLPDIITEKYTKLINKEKNIIKTPIDYLNESIQGITFPGITELLMEQKQYSIEHPENHNAQHGLLGKRISVEPERANNTYSPKNILSQISNEFKVSFRKNQGLYNYFMLYETIFYKSTKEYFNTFKNDDFFEIDILNETGNVIIKIKLFQPKIDSIDGLELSYNKLERQVETFDITFKYNNIDFEIIE